MIETCLFRWNKDTLPTAENITTLFRFNPEMHPVLMENNEIVQQGEDVQRAEAEEEDCVSWNIISSYSDDGTKARTFF